MNSPSSGSMLFVPDALSQYLDGEAIRLRARLRPEAPEDLQAVSRANFQSTILLGVIHIDGREHPVHRVKSITSPEGLETARYFARGGDEENWVGFAGEDFDAFLALCRQFHAWEEVHPVVSFTFLVEAAFEWFHRTDLQTQIPQTFTFSTATLAACESEIHPLELWIPVEGMDLENAFRVGQIEFKNVSMQEFDNWRLQWGAQWAHQNHPYAQRAGRVFGELQARLQEGFTVAVMQLRAEQVRAVERTLDEVERTLGLLRFFSRVNFQPSGLSHCSIECILSNVGPRYILLQNRVLTSSGRVSPEWPDRPLERFHRAELNRMRSEGLSILHRILQLEPNQRTRYESQLLKSLEIYAKASLTRNNRDKLLYIVVALESFFIQGKEGSLRKRVAERLAFLLGQSLEERHAIIDTYTAAYEARSNAVHRGDDPKDREMLRDFLILAWRAFRQLIGNPEQHKTPGGLLERLDETKFR